MSVDMSIITPVRNGADYIARCIENVASQGCSDRIEHIIIDGLSTDGTDEIARNLQSSFPHLKVISQKDNGQSDAMNNAIKMAKSEIIGILNADDFYSEGVLIRALSIMKNLPDPALIVGNCNVWNEDKEILYINKPTRLEFRQLLTGWRNCPHPVNPSAYFYHKELHDIVGWYDTNDHYAMDLDFILHAVQAANLRYFDEMWGNFLLREGAKTFESKKTHLSKSNYKAVVKRHMEGLPFSERAWVRKERLKGLCTSFPGRLLRKVRNLRQGVVVR